MSCVYVAHFMSILIQSLIYEVLTCYIINNVLQLNWSFGKKGQFCIRYKDDLNEGYVTNLENERNTLGYRELTDLLHSTWNCRTVLDIFIQRMFIIIFML